MAVTDVVTVPVVEAVVGTTALAVDGEARATAAMGGAIGATAVIVMVGVSMIEERVMPKLRWGLGTCYFAI